MFLYYFNRNAFYFLDMQDLVTTVWNTQLKWLGKLHFPQFGGPLTGGHLHPSLHKKDTTFKQSEWSLLHKHCSLGSLNPPRSASGICKLTQWSSPAGLMWTVPPESCFTCTGGCRSLFSSIHYLASHCTH